MSYGVASTKCQACPTEGTPWELVGLDDTDAELWRQTLEDIRRGEAEVFTNEELYQLFCKGKSKAIPRFGLWQKHNGKLKNLDDGKRSLHSPAVAVSGRIGKWKMETGRSEQQIAALKLIGQSLFRCICKTKFHLPGAPRKWWKVERRIGRMATVSALAVQSMQGTALLQFGIQLRKPPPSSVIVACYSDFRAQ